MDPGLSSEWEWAEHRCCTVGTWSLLSCPLWGGHLCPWPVWKAAGCWGGGCLATAVSLVLTAPRWKETLPPPAPSPWGPASCL